MFELLMVCDTGGCCLHLLRYIGWKLEKQKPSLWLGILHTLQRNRAPVKYVIERFFARHDLPIVYLLLVRFIIFSTRAVDHSKRKQSYLERRGRRWLRKFNGRRKSIFVLKKKCCWNISSRSSSPLMFVLLATNFGTQKGAMNWENSARLTRANP